MSIDFDDAWNRARDGSAFSNGTEWETWSANWCHRCLRDAPFRNGLTPRGCRLIEVALAGRIPAEWMEQPRDSGGDRYHCVSFRAPGGGGSGEPRPRPEPPDMDGLFPRPEQRVRMLTNPIPELAPAVRTLQPAGRYL